MIKEFYRDYRTQIYGIPVIIFAGISFFVVFMSFESESFADSVKGLLWYCFYDLPLKLLFYLWDNVWFVISFISLIALFHIVKATFNELSLRKYERERLMQEVIERNEERVRLKQEQERIKKEQEEQAKIQKERDIIKTKQEEIKQKEQEELREWGWMLWDYFKWAGCDKVPFKYIEKLGQEEVENIQKKFLEARKEDDRRHKEREQLNKLKKKCYLYVQRNKAFPINMFRNESRSEEAKKFLYKA